MSRGRACPPHPALGLLRHSRAGRRPMSHAALVNDGLFVIVVLMTLLLVMFLYAVIETLEVPFPPKRPCSTRPCLHRPRRPPHCRSGGHRPPCSPLVLPA